MKHGFFILGLLILSSFVSGQEFNVIDIPDVRDKTSQEPVSEKFSITIGILQGGGSLIGADMEYLVVDRIGIQAGMGYVGFGAALNVHLKPVIRSPFISLAYWHQGVRNSFAQSVGGMTFVWRSKKWFTAQLGLGLPIDIGPAMPDDYNPNVILLYSIGVYIPW